MDKVRVSIIYMNNSDKDVETKFKIPPNQPFTFEMLLQQILQSNPNIPPKDVRELTHIDVVIRGMMGKAYYDMNEKVPLETIAVFFHVAEK